MNDDTLMEAAAPEFSEELILGYCEYLTNRFFKILPLWEEGEDSIGTYMESFQAELFGCQGVVNVFKDDPSYLSLMSILQYLIDTPDCEVEVVKREVFRAIRICKKIASTYTTGGEQP